MLVIAGEPEEVDFGSMLLGAQVPIAVLLPVLAILAVTSEWTHRTALTTFALVPNRARVMLAKTVAMLVLALLAAAASIVAAAAGNVVAAGTGADQAHWGSAATVGRVVFFQVLMVLTGVGLGMLLLSAPQAIVVFFVAPTLLVVVASLVDVLAKPARWIDLTGTTTRLLGDPMDARAWGQVATSVTVWAVLPIVLARCGSTGATSNDASGRALAPVRRSRPGSRGPWPADW
ncbi:MAG TPA: hypothetical protein VEZ46_16440 [Mycobacteriales bacterium]|nr:hypothetical protein [Mycobacteriales bacterium]